MVTWKARGVARHLQPGVRGTGDVGPGDLETAPGRRRARGPDRAARPRPALVPVGHRAVVRASDVPPWSTTARSAPGEDWCSSLQTGAPLSGSSSSSAPPRAGGARRAAVPPRTGTVHGRQLEAGRCSGRRRASPARRWPGVGPVRPGQRQPDVVPGREDVGRGLQLDRDLDVLADRDRDRRRRARRWVRLRNPRVTRAEVPSGNTSSSFADSDATAASERPARVRTGGRGPRRLVLDRPVVGQRPGVVLPLVERLPPRQPRRRRSSTPRCRRPAARPACRSSRRRCGRHRAGRSTTGRVRAARPARSATTPSCSARSGSGRVAWRTKTRIGGSRSTPVVVVPQPAAEPADHLGHEVDVGAR